MGRVLVFRRFSGSGHRFLLLLSCGLEDLGAKLARFESSGSRFMG